jgi:hypothetical protein
MLIGDFGDILAKAKEANNNDTAKMDKLKNIGAVF